MDNTTTKSIQLSPSNMTPALACKKRAAVNLIGRDMKNTELLPTQHLESLPFNRDAFLGHW
jgi:hypothetical protein